MPLHKEEASHMDESAHNNPIGEKVHALAMETAGHSPFSGEKDDHEMLLAALLGLLAGIGITFVFVGMRRK